MPRSVVQKTSFLGGEAGPLLEGRSDLVQYQLGARKLENFIVNKSGSAMRRPPTIFASPAPGNKKNRIIPFVFSQDKPSDMYALLLSLSSPTALSVSVLRLSDYSVVSILSTIPVDSATINIDEIQFTQSADSAFIVHQSFEPYVIQRTGPLLFTLSTYILYATKSRPLAASLPYLDINVDISLTVAIDVATVGTGRTLTFSSAYLTGTSEDIGRWFAVKIGSTFGSALITAPISTTQATVQVIDAFGGLGPVDTWYEGAWSKHRGFPRTICFYDQRLVFGGTTKNPDTFWMSKIGNFFQMSAVGSAFAISNPLSFQLNSQRLNQIQWMVGGKKHTIGTSSSEWVGTVTNDGTNLFVQYNEETTFGSAKVQAQRSSYAIPFVQRSGRVIREIMFDFYSDTYVATDLTLFSNHVGATPPDDDKHDQTYVNIVACAYQESPLNILWALDSAGALYGMTRDKQQQVATWHSHFLGGSYNGGKPKIVSMALLPSPNGKADRLWFCVLRTVNGADSYTIEYMDDIKVHPDLTIGFNINFIQDLYDIRLHLDCASFSTTGLPDASNTSLWSGVCPQFVGGTAYVIAATSNGLIVFFGELPVNGGGDIVLPNGIKAQKIIVGAHANASIRLLPIEGGDNPKYNVRSIKRIDLCAVKLFETFGLNVGKERIATKTGLQESSVIEPIPFDDTQLPLLPTFTGVKEFQAPSDGDTIAAYSLVMDKPWPCTILSVSSRVVMNEI